MKPLQVQDNMAVVQNRVRKYRRGLLKAIVPHLLDWYSRNSMNASMLLLLYIAAAAWPKCS